MRELFSAGWIGSGPRPHRVPVQPDKGDTESFEEEAPASEQCSSSRSSRGSPPRCSHRLPVRRRQRVATATGGKITIAGLGFVQTFGDAGTGAAARSAANDNKEVKGYAFEKLQELADDKNDPEHHAGRGASARDPGRHHDRARRLGGDAGRLPDAAADPVVRGRLRHDLLPDIRQQNGFSISAYRLPDPDQPEEAPRRQLAAAEDPAGVQGDQQPDASRCSAPTRPRASRACRTRRRPPRTGFKVVYAKGAFPGPPTVVGHFLAVLAGPAHVERQQAGRRDLHVDRAHQRALAHEPHQQQRLHGDVPVAVLHLLIKALKGAYVFVQFAGFEANYQGIKTMNDTIEKFKPGTKPSLALAAGYFSASSSSPR